MSDAPKDDDGEGRILIFRRPGAGKNPPQPQAGQPPVENLGKYEGDSENDDYRHRMVTNSIVFAFVIALIGAGIWLVDTMATIRKNQDCVLSGRRGCSPVEYQRDAR